MAPNRLLKLVAPMFAVSAFCSCGSSVGPDIIPCEPGDCDDFYDVMLAPRFSAENVRIAADDLTFSRAECVNYNASTYHGTTDPDGQRAYSATACRCVFDNAYPEGAGEERVFSVEARWERALGDAEPWPDWYDRYPNPDPNCVFVGPRNNCLVTYDEVDVPGACTGEPRECEWARQRSGGFEFGEDCTGRPEICEPVCRLIDARLHADGQSAAFEIEEVESYCNPHPEHENCLSTVRINGVCYQWGRGSGYGPPGVMYPEIACDGADE